VGRIMTDFGGDAAGRIGNSRSIGEFMARLRSIKDGGEWDPARRIGYFRSVGCFRCLRRCLRWRDGWYRWRSFGFSLFVERNGSHRFGFIRCVRLATSDDRRIFSGVRTDTAERFGFTRYLRPATSGAQRNRSGV